MARISGVLLPDNKKTFVALTYIYGIGPKVSQNVLAAAKVDGDIRVKDLTEDQENAIRTEIDKIKTEGDLRREVNSDIKRLTDINCYRGTRHKKRLPVRGQRTKTNSRTKRGAKGMAPSGRKKGA